MDMSMCHIILEWQYKDVLHYIHRLKPCCLKLVFKSVFIMKRLFAGCLSFLMTSVLVSATQAATLTHRYSFTSDASDSVGTAHGSLLGGATISSGAVTFNGTSAYVELPANLVSNYDSVSFEVWFNDFGSSSWARLWDIGNSVNGAGAQGGGVSYMFLAMPDSAGGYRGAYQATGQGEQLIDCPTRPTLGQMHHLVWTQDSASQTACIYLDGVQTGINTSFSDTPSAIGATVNDWLGRSQYDDPYFWGTISEFRVYQGALSASDVSQDYQLGPDQSPQIMGVKIASQPQSIMVNEGASASFTVGYYGLKPVLLQWLRNGQPITAATNDTLSLATVKPADNGAVFCVLLTNVVSNIVQSAVSSNALLTVIPDTTPPELVRAFNLGQTTVQVIFSELVDPATATNAGNYSLSSGASILKASLAADGTSVSLTVSPLAFGTNYSLIVNNIKDMASTPNVIATNAATQFTATAYTVQDIGSAAPASILTAGSNGVTLAASGSDIGGGADQCGFAYNLRTGNFDIQTRVQGIAAYDLWSKAGLMARATLDANSPCAAVIATPGLEGGWFEYRASAGVAMTINKSIPPCYPNMWLRLSRTGNLFSGYASYDGDAWFSLGSATLSLPATLYVGIAAASHANGQTASASFQNLGETTSTATAAQPTTESLGPSSRRTPLAISEIMYKPIKRADGKNLEYIEIFNSNPFRHDLGGYRISGDIDYTFPANTVLPGWGFLVVAAAPSDVQSVYGIQNVYGPYTNSLKSSATIQLEDEVGARLLSISYKSDPPWPLAADGAGHSLVLSRPSYGENDPRAWSASDVIGGSPGNYEGYATDPARNVVFNEIVSEGATGGTVELYNHGNQPVDLSGCVLTDSTTVNQYSIPAGTVLPARGFRAFDMTQCGLSLSAAGGGLFLKDAALTRVIDAVRIPALEPGVAYGHSPDGGSQWYRLAGLTPGASNAAPLVDDIGINEIMYYPISGTDEAQYVELYNHGTNNIDLAGWKFVSGISYTMPSGTTLAAGGYLVVARNRSLMLSNYLNLNLTNTVGNFSGTLAHGGERLALSKPFPLVTTSARGVVTTNILDVVVDEVTWENGGRWGDWSSGGGSSLEVIDPRANKRLASNWADSDESAKAPWTVIEATGVLDNGANYESSIAHGQVGLLDAGECLIDDVEVRLGTTGANWVSNPAFDQNTSYWSLQGCFTRSGIDAGAGYPQSGNALHLRTAERLWTGANSAQFTLSTTTLTAGQTATLRFKARWLKGWPEAMMRLNGNWLEAAGRMTVPANLGTPGSVNSRAVSNAAPAIYGVVHAPALPAASQPVVVTASASDPDGLSSLRLFYRIDPATTYASVPMLDDGTGGDAVAGDGVLSATIPAQAAGTTVAFFLSATDGLGMTNRFPALKNDNAPVRECLVAFGDPNPPSAFGAYHLWVTKANASRWSNLPALSNEDVDGTLVCGSRVIYNMGTHYAGSPYHQGFTTPTGVPCHYNWTMPQDDKFLGSASFNKIHWIGNDIQNDTPTQNVNDNTLQREQVANTFLRGLGAPWINRRYVAVYVNGTRRGYLMEDALRPTVSVPDEYFPNDSGGTLMKIQPWFEFGPTASGNYFPWANESWSYLTPYTTTSNAFKTARYRWCYELRQTPDSMSRFTNLYTLIAAANSSSANYAALLKNQVNMENLTRLLAAMHAAGNWDCIGIQNGQNVYAYVSPQAPWTFFVFDASICVGNSISWSPGANLFATTSDGYATMLNNPEFMRLYLRALKELVSGPMAATNLAAFVDGRYAAFRADGLPAVSPSVIKTWVSQAAASITSQVASRDTSAFTVTSTNYTATGNAVTLSGYAPVLASTLLIDGIAYPVTWTTPTRWSVTLPASTGTNSHVIAAYDRHGAAVGVTNTVSVVNTATAESPVGNVVINEICFNPPQEDAQYVELYNRATNTTFDLSGWEFNGLSYTFPQGASLAPGGYLVLTKSAIEFANVTGGLIPVFDQYNGNLQANGETLTLLASNTVIDRVRYETNAPWPACAVGTSLQLVDPSRDNSRAGNWATGRTTAIVSPAQWVYYSSVGTATSSTLYLYLQSAGDVYIDDIKLVSGSVPDLGANLLSNGDFESSFPGSWGISTNLSSSVLSTTVKHSGNYSLHLISTSAGSSRGTSIYQDITPSLTIGQPYSLSFWYLQSTNGGPLTLRLSSSGINATVSPAPATLPAEALTTPGSANSVAASLPAFPMLWLNEVEPDNINGITNEFGERAAWIEIYNSDTSAVSLTGLYLSTNYSKPTLWNFPAGASITPGQMLVVWADGRSLQTGSNVWHTNFKLTPTQGSVLLSRQNGASFQTIDYLNYAGLAAGQSYGDIPDGQPFWRGAMFYPSPGATNTDALPPITVYINEWMAENSKDGGIADPVDGHYDDWFELYNAGTNTADLAGYYLSDDPADPFKFKIPSGYVIPAGGFLLVWADNETNQNSASRADLHVSFKLSKSGEQIGLYAENREQIDLVIFGAQTLNVSEGHYPDGTGPIISMPTPSPRAPNIVPRTPPVLDSIADQFIYQGQTLQLTATVNYAQTPVTFSLGANAPAGASMDAASGLFSWTPSINTAPGVSAITIIATDANALTDSKLFNITVAALPSVSQSLTLGQGSLQITFPTLPRQIYQLQTTEVIEPSNWQTLSSPVTGDGSMATISVAVGETKQRFYRLVATHLP